MRLGLDPKTVRRYVAVAEGIGLRVDSEALSETQVRDVLRRSPTKPIAGSAIEDD